MMMIRVVVDMCGLSSSLRYCRNDARRFTRRRQANMS